jgi:3-hydroxyisobutyrate dehydrogenase-like beta-hydroxyacid dehydrogenase
MTTAVIGTGTLGSVIARLLASGGKTLRLSSADNRSARMLAAKIGRVVARPNQSVGTHAHHNYLGWRRAIRQVMSTAGS